MNPPNEPKDWKVGGRYYLEVEVTELYPGNDGPRVMLKWPKTGKEAGITCNASSLVDVESLLEEAYFKGARDNRETYIGQDVDAGYAEAKKDLKIDEESIRKDEREKVVKDILNKMLNLSSVKEGNPEWPIQTWNYVKSLLPPNNDQ